MTLAPGARLARTRSSRRSAPAAWARSIARATRSSIATSRIKVLPELFAADPERLARFEREAQLLASLNHPNIAQIYGLEESDGVRALVMELVEGETLADAARARARSPLDEALADRAADRRGARGGARAAASSIAT